MHRFMILLTVALLIPAGAEVEAKDKDGWTPLRYAAGNFNIVTMLSQYR